LINSDQQVIWLVGILADAAYHNSLNRKQKQQAAVPTLVCGATAPNQGGTHDSHTIHLQLLDCRVPARICHGGIVVPCGFRARSLRIEDLHYSDRKRADGHAENVDELQKNMGTIKQAKDQLSSVSAVGGDAMKKEGDSLKQMMPGLGQ
jgi:hypothetical protein